MFSFLVLLSAIISRVASLYVYLGENGDPKCFTLTLSKDTILSEQHSAWELEADTNKWIRDDSLQIEITIDELFDNNHQVYNHKKPSFGDFQFTTLDGGDHRVCYHALVNSWWAKNKVKLDVDFVEGVGRDVVDHESERRLGQLAGRASTLVRKFVHIQREQRVLRERETSFRDLSEYTNSRVAYMTVFQLIVLGLTCTWQVTHLKSFFVKQKLV